MFSGLGAGLNAFPQTPSSAAAAKLPVENKEGGFGQVLQSAIDQVEGLHVDAQNEVKQLLEGGRDDVHNVAIAMEKADVAFQLMMQVRNKIVNAYQEVSRMQF
jgi:flagellar hook-basal body complex protein FliE